MGLVCMVILMLMRKLKEFADAKLKTETNKTKKALYKFMWLLCTGIYLALLNATCGKRRKLHVVCRMAPLRPTCVDGYFTRYL